MCKFQVFIATHNRSDIICKTIDSVLDQKGLDFDLVISDNSTNDQTEKIIKDKYASKVKYVRRSTPVDAISHWDLILKEVTADYFMIFHDDDIMRTGMLSKVSKAFALNPDVIAIGANAYTVENNKRSKTWFLKDHKKDQMVLNGTEMAKRYFKPNQIVPFPGYSYRKIVAEEFCFNSEKGGKYSDVAFLIDVANRGKILFIAQPLLDYYIHSEQYSFNNDFSARLKLVNYILKNTDLTKKDKLLRSYRLNNIYKDIVSMENKSLTSLFRKRAVLLMLKQPISYFKMIVLTLISWFKSSKL